MLIDKYVRKSKFKFRKYEPLPDGDGLNAGGIFGHTPPEVNFGNILQAAFLPISFHQKIQAQTVNTFKLSILLLRSLSVDAQHLAQKDAVQFHQQICGQLY